MKLGMDLTNLLVGIGLIIMGVIIIFVGNYFSKKIGILHVVIYFMAAFVILTGILLIFLHDQPSIIFKKKNKKLFIFGIRNCSCHNNCQNDCNYGYNYCI